MRNPTSFLLVIACTLCAQGLTFVQAPQITKTDDSSYQIVFEVSDTTDVEVAVVDLSDSSIVCRLAAGRLGSNPPPPLAANALAQTLTWNGRDDYGALKTGAFGVRVRAGMSTRLDNVVDKVREDGTLRSSRYYFSCNIGDAQFFGLAVDNGALYVLGSATSSWYCPPLAQCLRAFDASTGQYRSTIFPPPADADRSLLVPYGINLLDDNRFNLKYFGNSWATFHFGAIQSSAKTFAGAIFPELNQGALGMVRYSRSVNMNSKERDFNIFAEINVSSEMVTRPSFIQSPALPALVGGPLYLAYLPGKNAALVSGLYGMDAVSFTGKPMQSGFWRDGQVFKVDLATGNAVAIISLNQDSLPQNSPVPENQSPDAAIHGVATDDSGHIFICDRMHNQIGIYDTAGNFIKAVHQAFPDNVAVNKATGELYVAARGPGICTLKKFSDWRGASPASVATFSYNAVTKSYLAVSQVPGGAAVVWVTGGHNQEGGFNGGTDPLCLMGLRDDGASLTKICDFADSCHTGITGYVDRIAVDRKHEIPYVTNAWSVGYKVEDWSDPVMVRCSTNTGEALPMVDMQTDRDGNLYTYTVSMDDGKIRRFTGNHLHAELPYASRGSNVLVDSLCNEWGLGVKTEGFTLTYDGKVFVVHQGHDYLYEATDNPPYARLHETCEWWDTNKTVIDSNVLTFHREPYGGVRVDKAGNLYLSAWHQPTGLYTPAGYESDGAYNYSGAVSKFNPLTGGVYSGGCCEPVNLAGQLRTYLSTRISPFSTGCECRQPRYDVDAYGRLFIPDAYSNTVAVLDNTDNLINRFGEYGNADAKTPGAAVPLLYPVGTAVTDNYIYVSDQLNNRIVRVRMDYALTNMDLPEAGAFVGANNYSPLQLTASPNPFNPVANLSLTGFNGKNATLKIFDLSGKLVADLSGKISAGRTVWNAAGHASGMYVVVAQKGALKLTEKIVYSK